MSGNKTSHKAHKAAQMPYASAPVPSLSGQGAGRSQLSRMSRRTALVEPLPVQRIIIKRTRAGQRGWEWNVTYDDRRLPLLPLVHRAAASRCVRAQLQGQRTKHTLMSGAGRMFDWSEWRPAQDDGRWRRGWILPEPVGVVPAQGNVWFVTVFDRQRKIVRREAWSKQGPVCHRPGEVKCALQRGK